MSATADLILACGPLAVRKAKPTVPEVVPLVVAYRALSGVAWQHPAPLVGPGGEALAKVLARMSRQQLERL